MHIAYEPRKPAVRVHTPSATARMGLQNAALRRLREAGVKVLSAHLDARLTILIEDRHGNKASQLARGGKVTRNMGPANEVSVDLHGCRVVWMEPAS